MRRRYRLVPLPPTDSTTHSAIGGDIPGARIAQVEKVINAYVATADHDPDVDDIEWMGITARAWGLPEPALIFEVTTRTALLADRRAAAEAAIPVPATPPPVGVGVLVAVDRAWLVDVVADAMTYSGDDAVRSLRNPILLPADPAASVTGVVPPPTGPLDPSVLDLAEPAPPPTEQGTTVEDRGPGC